MSPADTPWTIDEVADYFREDARTTRRRVARGELQPIVLPGSRRYLFDPEQVRRFVEGARPGVTR
jgi:hypothetical protein